MEDTNQTNTDVNTGANNESAGTDPKETKNEGKEASKELSFDEFLNKNKNQAEFDRRVAKALKTAREDWQQKNDADKTEAERLAQMNETEKLQYQLQKQQKDYESMQKKLNARDLKDEGIKIATSQDTSFDPEFLNLFDYENMTAEQLQEKTKLIKTIQDRIVEKTINEWSKEKPPYNPNANNKTAINTAISQAFGNTK